MLILHVFSFTHIPYFLVTVHMFILRNWGTCAELVMSITRSHTAVRLCVFLWAVRSKEDWFPSSPPTACIASCAGCCHVLDTCYINCLCLSITFTFVNFMPECCSLWHSITNSQTKYTADFMSDLWSPEPKDLTIHDNFLSSWHQLIFICLKSTFVNTNFAI